MSPPVMGRQLQKEQTRARILEAARVHFERDGFENASLRGIAHEAGVAAGTVVLHFSDKLGLLHAALYDDLERAIDRSLGASREGNVVDRLAAVVQPAFEYYATRPRLSRTLLRSALFADSPWRERFSAQATRVHMHIATLAEDARAVGELAPATDAGILATALLSFFYFTLLGWMQGAVQDPMALFRILLGQHLQGALTSQTNGK